MFAATRYLEWARRYYGKVRLDLASSGVPTANLSELGVPPVAGIDDPAGWERMRAAIARYNGVPEAEAIGALGTTHALWLAYSALTSPGDAVLVESPVYEPLVRIAEGLGLKVRTFERAAVDGFALDPSRVEQALMPDTRVVAITNLHNPTGVRATDDALRAVALAAGARGATLLVDEVYSPFDALTDSVGVFHGSARRLAQGIVTVSSLTKCYGLGPQRIGWLLGPREVIARAEDALTASAGILPLPHAHIATHAFEAVAKLGDRARAGLPVRRAKVAAWIAAEGLTWSAPAEGLFGLVGVPGIADVRSVVERAARESEVLVAPGDFFGVPGSFRISWAQPLGTVEEGLARLAEALRRASR